MTEDDYKSEISRLTKERDLALANADGVYAKLMPEIERLRQLGVQRKSKQGKVAASRNRMAEGVEHWKAEAERLRTALENAEQFVDLYINGSSSAEDAKHTLAHIQAALGHQQQASEPK